MKDYILNDSIYMKCKENAWHIKKCKETGSQLEIEAGDRKKIR